MYTHADKVQKNTRKSAANEVSRKRDDGQSTFQFSANHPAIIQRQLQEKVGNSHQVKQLKALQKMLGNNTQNKGVEQCRKPDHNDTEQDIDNYKQNEYLRLINPHESIVQRDMIRENEAKSDVFDEAFHIFWDSLKSQGGVIGKYLEFVEDAENDHNLIFKTILPKQNQKQEQKGVLQGVTNVTFKGGSRDIIAYLYDENIEEEKIPERIDEIIENVNMDKIKAFCGVNIEISIVIHKSSDKAYILETLNHEFTVHAIKWYDFIESVYSHGEVEAELRKRILDLSEDHKEFSRDKNELYTNVRTSIISNVDENEVVKNQEEEEDKVTLLSDEMQGSEKLRNKLLRISEESIYTHLRAEERMDKVLKILGAEKKGKDGIDGKKGKDDIDGKKGKDDIDGKKGKDDKEDENKNQMSIDNYFKNRQRKKNNLGENLLGKNSKNKSKKSNRCCYITTACVQFKGLHDDCEELTLLRKFRDTYLMQKKNGDELIDLYYEYSPAIVESIELRNDKDKIYQRLYKIIRQCVDAIKNGNNEFAYQVYCEMVINLKEEFAPDLNIAIPSLS